MMIFLKSLGLSCCLLVNADIKTDFKINKLIDFNDDLKWSSVNDDVMGGKSNSMFIIKSGVGVFSGKVSLENNGGFASTRHTLKNNPMLPATTHINIEVKGDGRVYQFRVRDKKSKGIAYKMEFKTIADKWIQVQIPIKSMVSSFRGRYMPGFVDPPAPDVSQISLLIADKKAGSFKLEVKTISFN